MRGIAREAIFAGTPADVSQRVGARQSGRWQMQETLDMMQRGGWMAPPRPVPPGAPAAPAAPSAPDPIAALKQLAALKEQGVLTDAEFSAEKTKLLAP
jgi:hypothetical protein